MSQPLQIAVFGAGAGDAGCDGGSDERVADLAFQVGRGLASAGATLVCGGRGGVMDAACRGARSEGGMTIGILPGTSAADSPPNDHLTATVYTGMGQARNLAVALSGYAAIAISGGWGTLSEISLARKHGVPVVSLDSWTPEKDPDLHVAQDAEQAVEMALRLAKQRLAKQRLAKQRLTRRD